MENLELAQLRGRTVLAELDEHKGLLRAVLAGAGPWVCLDARHKGLAQALLLASDESELPELLEYCEPSLTLTMEVRTRESMDRLQVEAYLTAGPQTSAQVKMEMPPDYFELLSIEGYSVLSRPPSGCAGYPMLSAAAAAECAATHAVVMTLMALEVAHCEHVARENFSKVGMLSTFAFASAAAAASAAHLTPPLVCAGSLAYH